MVFHRWSVNVQRFRWLVEWRMRGATKRKNRLMGTGSPKWRWTEWCPRPRVYLITMPGTFTRESSARSRTWCRPGWRRGRWGRWINRTWCRWMSSTSRIQVCYASRLTANNTYSISCSGVYRLVTGWNDTSTVANGRFESVRPFVFFWWGLYPDNQFVESSLTFKRRICTPPPFLLPLL